MTGIGRLYRSSAPISIASQVGRLRSCACNRCCTAAASVQPVSSAVSMARRTQTFLTELPGQFQQFHHLSCSGLLAVTDHQRLPDLIEAVWPQTSPALLLERTRAGQGTWLS